MKYCLWSLFHTNMDFSSGVDTKYITVYHTVHIIQVRRLQPISSSKDAASFSDVCQEILVHN